MCVLLLFCVFVVFVCWVVECGFAVVVDCVAIWCALVISVDCVWVLILFRV